MRFDLSPKQEILITAEDVCSVDSRHVHLIAKMFEYSSPLGNLVCFLIEVDISGPLPKFMPVLNGFDLFPEYYSNFNAIAHDVEGCTYIVEDGNCIKHKGGNYEIVSLKKLRPPIGVIRSIYVGSPERLVVGGGRGKVAVIDKGVLDDSFEIVPDDGYSSIVGIHGIGVDYIVAVGARGAVARFANEKWEKIMAPSNENLYAVWCAAPDQIYIGGVNGRMWRWDGDGHWQTLSVGGAIDRGDFDVCGFAAFEGTLYGAFGNIGVYRLEGDDFIEIPEMRDKTIGRLRVTTAGLVGVGTGWSDYSNWFVRFDGTRWTSDRVSFVV